MASKQPESRCASVVLETETWHCKNDGHEHDTGNKSMRGKDVTCLDDAINFGDNEGRGGEVQVQGKTLCTYWAGSGL